MSMPVFRRIGSVVAVSGAARRRRCHIHRARRGRRSHDHSCRLGLGRHIDRCGLHIDRFRFHHINGGWFRFLIKHGIQKPVHIIFGTCRESEEQRQACKDGNFFHTFFLFFLFMY